MKCPKCGFETAGESCAKCGVVFAKLSSPRSPRPATRRIPAGGGRSHVSWRNVALLVSAFALPSSVLWRLANPPAVDEAELPSAARPAFPTVDSADERESTASPSDGSLTLRGLEPANANAIHSRAPRPQEVGSTGELPLLTADTVTPELIEQLADLVAEYPEDELVRQSAAQAYLMLGARRLAEQRYREALALAAEAEALEASPQTVAQISACACLGLQDLGAARRWAETALSFGPDPVMYDVLGNVHYFREEMSEAIEAWERSLTFQEDPKVRAALEKALREVRLAEGFDRRRLSHFIVRYEGETMEGTGRLVLGSLERSYSSLKSLLGFEPAEPVVVLLYTRRDYSELGGPYWSAGLFDGKVRVPVLGMVNLDRQVETILRHELTHAFLYGHAGNNCPRWLQEGMAEHCEGIRSDEFGRMLAEKIEEDGNFRYCLTSQRCDVRYFYSASVSLVDYMLQNRGMGGMRDVLAHLGEGLTIDQALQTVIGRDEVELIQDWQHFIRRRYY